MNVKSRMSFQPRLHFRVFVRRVVVDNQMKVERMIGIPINRLKELDPLLMPVSLLALREDRAIGHTQGGKQCCCA